ncbi:MAG: hypothetical protein AMK75_04245, partial [Planctomycetes bacterium SM23_65]
MSKTRLVVSSGVNDLKAFRRLAELCARAKDRFDVRIDIGQLARKKTFELTDPGDSYLEYSVKQSCLADFFAPAKLMPFVNAAFIAENASLMDAKSRALHGLGLGAAFLGHEPIYYRQPVYEAYPHWRGPRVDHPRRSRNPIWSMCMVQDEVRELYREMPRELVKRCGALDTFGFLSNDCATGLCWHVGLYPGPNGPEACKELGEGPHAAAFERALIEGAADSGAEAQVYLWHMGDEANRRMVRGYLPEGGGVMPADGPGGGANVGSALAGTFPVRYIENPFAFLEGLERVLTDERRAVFMRMGVGARSSKVDFDGVELTFDVLEAFCDKPTASLAERVQLLTELATRREDEKAAPALVEAWHKVHEALRFLQAYTTGRKMLLYGVVSTRWLTRPLVPFPEELGEDEKYFLRHIFNVGGDEVRRNILDVHGGRWADAIDRTHDYGMRIEYYRRVDAGLTRAAEAMDEAAQAGASSAARCARALRVLRCVVRNCRHTTDFGLLLARAKPKDVELAGGFMPVGDEDGQRVYQLVRAEIDNTVEILNLIGD